MELELSPKLTQNQTSEECVRGSENVYFIIFQKAT